MLDLDVFIDNIKHSKDINGYVESSSKTAIQLDGKGGVAQQLNFREGCLKKVDYLKIKEDKVFLIELTNLQEDIKECIECDEELSNSSDIRNYVKKLDKKGLHKVQKKLWMEVTEEFKGKWMGSIAFYERILRRMQKIDSAYIDPNYHLVIVLKNDTDPKDRDLLEITLRNNLSGMISNIDVFITDGL